MECKDSGSSTEGQGLRRRSAGQDDESIDDRSITTENIFNDNDRCLIDDPFIGLRPDQADARARSFVHRYDLKNQEEVFVKAGRVLRDPEAWKYVQGLNDEEEDVLSREATDGFWQQPKDLKVTIIMLCVAGVVQGWNETAINGANLLWPSHLGLTSQYTECNPQGDSAWIFGIVNAVPYLSASLIGCWLSDPLNEYFLGRRFSVFTSATLILGSIIGSAFCNDWIQLLACRIVLGIGMGCKASVVPVFAAEVFDALGIFLGFTANLAVSGVGDTSWRWMTASSILPTIVLLSLVWTASESPRYLIKRGAIRYHDAYLALLRLRGHPILAAKELLYIHYQMKIERQFISGVATDEEADGTLDQRAIRRNTWSRFRPPKSINYWQKLGQLFTIKRIRRAMVAAVVCMVGQQLCGVNALVLYSSTLYCDVNDQQGDVPKSLFLSWGIGLCNFLFSLPAYWLIDRRGRRWLLLVSLPIMAISTLAAALSYLISPYNNARVPVITLFTYVFMIFYSISMGPVPFTLSAEVFPLENRTVGMAFAVFTNFFWFGLLTLFVPLITNHLKITGLLGIFAGLNILTFVLVFFFVRETSGAALSRSIPGSMSFMSLEALNYVFGVSSRQYMVYQFKTVLPWAVGKYILRKPSPDRPQPLYTWALTFKPTELEEYPPSK